MPVKMHQVSYFLALCEEQNFTRAAKRCGVAQTSLTRAIQQLEQEFGNRLFERKPSRLSDFDRSRDSVRPDFEQIDGPQRGSNSERRKIHRTAGQT
jgi:hypothetical protein